MSILPQKLLSEVHRIQTIAKFKELPVLTQGNNATKNAAVLVPLCVDGDEVCLLYTLRSSALKSHSGQVSFPGGMQDKNESFIETALRETEEEVGVPREDVDVWGLMSTVQGRNTDLHITPVVGVIKNFNMSKLKINTNEVDEVFTVPMSTLCNPKNHGHLAYKPPLPVFIHSKHKIWGITGLITHQFLLSFIEGFEHNYKNQKFTMDELMPSKL